VQPTEFKFLTSFIWSVADLLRGSFKQSEYGQIIMPFVVMRRLDCILERTKDEQTIENPPAHAPMLSLAGRRWFSDTTNGFRAYSARCLPDPMVAPFRSVFTNCELFFHVTVRAGQLGHKVAEVPVRRSHQKGECVPTRIIGTSAKAVLFKQALDAARGCFRPEVQK